MNKTNEERNIQIGNLLKKARESRGVLQADIAQATGMSKNHISCVERGLCKASIDVLLGYCARLNMTPNKILDYEKPPIKPELLQMLMDMPPAEQQKLVDIIKVLDW